MGLDPAHALGDLAAMHAGHGVIEYDRLDRLLFEKSEPADAVNCCKYLVADAFEQDLSNFQPDEFVIHT